MDKLKIKLQYLLPKLWLTQLAGWFANKKRVLSPSLLSRLLQKLIKLI
ncbi:phosphatidylserine decarboxylase [Proteus penneri ATCC 35198]|nr:phosphatidylserine decarboxylase [Proteus penneri ATCC 35198]